jgi:transcriptional regulator with XRE-family HTH domain
MDALAAMSRDAELAAKIARLVEERGWNQEDFARIANLNRHTVREIMKSHGEGRRLRNATISQCAAALGLQVNELRNTPLERLLPRMHGKQPEKDLGGARKLSEQAISKELHDWLREHPERAAQITDEEADDLLSQDGPGKGIVQLGAEHWVELVERRRRILRRVHAIATTGYIDLLEPLVNLMFEKIQSPAKTETR